MIWIPNQQLRISKNKEPCTPHTHTHTLTHTWVFSLHPSPTPTQRQRKKHEHFSGWTFIPHLPNFLECALLGSTLWRASRIESKFRMNKSNRRVKSSAVLRAILEFCLVSRMSEMKLMWLLKKEFMWRKDCRHEIKLYMHALCCGEVVAKLLYLICLCFSVQFHLLGL